MIYTGGGGEDRVGVGNAEGVVVAEEALEVPGRTRRALPVVEDTRVDTQ